MNGYTSGLICQMPKTATIYISRHENGGIRRVPYIGYFSKKLPDVKEPRLSHIQNCAICSQEWIDMSTYTCGLVCQMPKPPTIYISRHENGGIRRVPYIGYFSKKLPDVKESQACHIFKPVQYLSRINGYEYLYMWPSIPDAENPNNLYFKAWKWEYTAGYHILAIFQRNCRM